MQNIKEVMEEANRCLNCKNPLCRKGCPIETRIPEFIQKIKEERFEEAYYILQENNAMSSICGMICPAEKQCMANCIRGIKEIPVRIRELEDFVNTWAEENKLTYKIKCVEVGVHDDSTKIAVIGSGPTGISCAVELIKKGFDVTLFEREEEIRWYTKIWYTKF